MSIVAKSASNTIHPVETPTPASLIFLPRVLATLVLVGLYYWFRERAITQINVSLLQSAGYAVDSVWLRVISVLLLLGCLLAVWWRMVARDPRFQAPLLITVILALGDAVFGMLENHPVPLWVLRATGGSVREYSPTFFAIAATIGTELVLGRFFWGKWPHLASAYISGISAGILIKSSALWPFLLCALISITSKYVLRIGERHLWNPTNFGVTMMLLLAPAHVASLTVQAGNNGLAVLIIWILGCMIMRRLGRFHIPVAFIAAFVPLAFLRSYVTGHPWQTEIAPLTSPMFQLYIFFMITDPKTTMHGWRRQVVVAVLVAVAETALRLGLRDVHSLYHALFVVGPITNLYEIYVLDRRPPSESAEIQTAGPTFSQPERSAPAQATQNP